jgi:hypothetical protein
MALVRFNPDLCPLHAGSILKERKLLPVTD